MIESIALGMTFGTKAEIEAKLRGEAEAAMKAYPQYAGHFAGYRLGRAKKTVKTKLGIAVEKGDLVIFTVDGATATFWSRRNACDTSIAAKGIEIA